ncbi:TnpR protein [Paramagnetospirillum magnetotacticum MS-1]|uniref:TnpR protein n=1 Tax=Paramagnetospirillum magnetotacticum MS-1 TaxID=272627 RepID=A0A0C2U643_PARME|nr:plasmid pRiA4b ORF-3 family protein [Paramagnetospirillum magnetotacticum]KIL96922.1 TnpR protein [Paramagnetospirillum magnetotacticum MS-1]
MIEPIARIRIELQDIEPKIWRRVDVPLSTSLMGLHDIIQVAMGWQDEHLFDFRVGDKIYSEPYPDDDMYERKTYNAKSIRLKTLVERGVGQFLYTYDFGDNWQHDIVIEGVRDGEAEIDYPVFVDGARRCPPDDVGGAPGFMDFLEAMLNPTHEEHRRMIEWYGKSFDPLDINEAHVRRVLSWFADRRRGPLASHRNGRRKKAIN